LVCSAPPRTSVLTFGEIGAALGVSPYTVASRYRYALKRLRAQLPLPLLLVPLDALRRALVAIEPTRAARARAEGALHVALQVANRARLLLARPHPFQVSRDGIAERDLLILLLARLRDRVRALLHLEEQLLGLLARPLDAVR
jgi:hypothetical protein